METSDVPGSMEPRSEMNIARTFVFELFTRSAAYYRGYVCLQFQDGHDSNTGTCTVQHSTSTGPFFGTSPASWALPRIPFG